MKQQIRIKSKSKSPLQMTHKDVNQAVDAYLKKGGEIQVVKPLWLEEADVFKEANNP